jgi:hypothetical protein
MNLKITEVPSGLDRLNLKKKLRIRCTEMSLDVCGAWGEAVYAGPLKISRCTRNKERKKRKVKEKISQLPVSLINLGQAVYFLNSVLLSLFWDYNEINRLYANILYVTFLLLGCLRCRCA